MQESDVEKLVNPCVMEKLGEVYQKDGRYLKLLKDEELRYEKLYRGLTEGKAEELKQYFEAVIATAARKEKLTYIQGMKDMYNLFMVLQSRE